ncbi:sensor histidine kinase [Culicoidibacter larvae]|uniref:histidine kinase n=1 Tax=Culicoidibacter larvae TaxID=2579976 RepID=A0A5R8QGP2_9FIRM|nr:HAMP domain-containing sensor histidine kinase [Culicoidibacter larvae]TLG77209.1 HAMP domain-containing histidine kinase [Culicoidibacter larvae]
MSGQNNTGTFLQRHWRKLFYTGGGIYLLLVIAMGTLVLNVPAIYNQAEKEHVTGIQTEVQSILNQTTGEEMVNQLTVATSSDEFDLVIKQDGKIVFNSVNETNFSELRDSVKEGYTSYHSAFEYTANNNQHYQIWIAIYRLPAQDFFELLMAVLLAGVATLTVIMTFLVFMLYRRLILPIRQLQQNILNLREYRFSELEASRNSSYNELSTELTEFSEDLQDKMHTFDSNYTRLERELQVEQEKTVYQQQLATAIVHDLKTPINVAIIQTEQLQQKLPPEVSEDTLFAELLDTEHKLIGAVNEVLQVMNKPGDNKDELQLIDAVAMSKTVMKLFNKLFEKQQILASLDVPSKLMVTFRPIELKQILHNIISNACHYTDMGGEFELSLDQENELFVIRAYNDKADVSNIDFAHVFDLFYQVGEDDDGHGSGVGMYTIRSMVEAYHGTCSFEPFENGVLLTIKLPTSGGNGDA